MSARNVPFFSRPNKTVVDPCYYYLRFNNDESNDVLITGKPFTKICDDVVSSVWWKDYLRFDNVTIMNLSTKRNRITKEKEKVKNPVCYYIKRV